MLPKDFRINDSWTTNKDRSTTNHAILGDFILRQIPLCRDVAGNIYYYDNGVYKLNGEEVISKIYQMTLEHWDAKTDWRPRRAQGIIEYITTKLDFIDHVPNLYKINLLNGIYHWEDEIFYPHDPKYLTTVQIPINYDPTAECPAWDKFLDELLPGGAILLTEIIGLCMIPFTKLQKCIVLLGKGSNGKSTYLKALRNAIGANNISSISLHTLTNPSEKFAKSGLVGKLVNIFGDLSNKKIEDAASFKPLVGEDSITVEFKNKNAFSYTPFARLIFSTNEMLKSDDSSLGYSRRFLIIPFTQKFAVNSAVGTELEDTLSSPQELSGLLNKILMRIRYIVEEGLTIPEEIAAIVENWVAVPDSAREFLEGLLEYSPNSYVPAKVFYRYYCEKYDRRDETQSNNQQRVMTYLRNIFGPISGGNHRINGKQVWCYKHLRCKDPALQAYLESETWDEDKVQSYSNL